MEISNKSMAFIKVDNRQVKVEEGRYILIDKREGKNGDAINFDKVLLVSKGEEVKVGMPYVKGASVTGKIEELVKGDKVVVFKKKRRKGYRVKNGHRQVYTKVTIEKINCK